MTTNASLWINHPNLLYLRIGGLSILERQLFTLSRAGVRRVWVNVRKPDEKTLAPLRLPKDLEILWADAKDAVCPTPYLAVSADHFIRAETLSYVAQASYPSRTSLQDASGASVVEAIPYEMEQHLQAKQTLPEGASVFLKLPLHEGPVMDWLLASAPKTQDGFMARHFDRHISMAVSRCLLEGPVTPNAMTAASCALGLLGAAFFTLALHGAAMVGALLVWVHSVLDGCDGELARIRFQESDFGGDIDFWGDNLVHLALFGCLGVGFYRADHNALPLGAAAAAAVGILGSATLTYLQKLARRRGASGAAPCANGIETALTRLENILAQRDFIYLLLFLAYIGRTYEFLWAGAVGSLLFFVMMLYLGRTSHEQAGQPNYSR